MLKERVEKLLQENDIWKRAFKTLHGQKEEFNRCSQELQQLKHMMSQRDEQLRKLQVTFNMFHFLFGFVSVVISANFCLAIFIIIIIIFCR